MAFRWVPLLLFFSLLLPATSAHVTDGTWVVPDEADDQLLVPGFIRFLPVPSVPNPLTIPSIDLRSIAFGGEDETGVGIDIKVASLKVGTLTPVVSSGCPAPNWGGDAAAAKLVAEFYLNEDDRFLLVVNIAGTWQAPAGTELEVTGAVGCVGRVDENDWALEPGQKVSITLDDAADTFHVWIPKVSLLGANPAPALTMTPERPGLKRPPSIQPGDKITKLSVESKAGPSRTAGDLFLTIASYVSDVAPDEGEAPTYTFVRPMANSVVRLAFDGGRSEMPIQADKNQTLTLKATNGAEGRRIVTFEYALTSPTGENPAYKIHGPSRATIPARESRYIQLALEVAPEARAGDNVTLAVRATSAGYPDEVGWAESLLVPGPHHGPDSNILYMQFERITCGVGGSQYYQDVLDSLNFGNCGWLFLSPLKDDPLADADADYSVGLGSGLLDPTFRGSWNAPTRGIGTPSPVLFDPTAAAKLELVFDVAQEIPDVTIGGTLSYYNVSGTRFTAVEWAGTHTLTTPRTHLTFEAPLRKFDPLLPIGTMFRIDLDLQAPASPGAATAVGPRSLIMRTVDSRITLPLVELPPELRTAAAGGALQLAALGSHEDFVNPGKSRLYNVTVLNQGGQAYTARLDALVDRPEWQVRFLPGDTFVLEPGDTIRLGVLVTAPPTEVEGARAQVRLNVTDDRRVSSQLLLRAVVVENLDVGDDAGRYRDDADALNKLVQAPVKKTPGPSLPALLGLAVVALWRPWSPRRPPE